MAIQSPDYGNDVTREDIVNQITGRTFHCRKEAPVNRSERVSRRLGAALFILTLLCAPAPAEEPIAAEETRRIVEQVETPYMQALTSGQVDDAVALFTEAATRESEWGTVRKGRPAIRKHLRDSFEANEAKRSWSSRITVATALTPDIIVTHGVTFIISGGGVVERLFHTRVLKKTKDGWRIAAEHLARPSTLPRTQAVAD